MTNIIRTRRTSFTERRTQNMKMLVDQLSVAFIARDDFGLLLKMSGSGARKYIRDLAGENIIVVASVDEPVRKGQMGAPVYGLTDDAELVAAFLKKLETEPRNLTERRAQVDHSTGAEPRMYKEKNDDGHLVHTLRDDVTHRPRASKFRIPAPDPLLAALFGLAPAESLL